MKHVKVVSLKMLPLPTSPIKRIFFSSHLSPNFYGPASRGGTLFGRYLKWRWVLSALPGNRESILCTVKCIKNHHRLFLSSSSSQFMLQSSRIFFKLWAMLFLSRYIAIASQIADSYSWWGLLLLWLSIFVGNRGVSRTASCVKDHARVTNIICKDAQYADVGLGPEGGAGAGGWHAALWLWPTLTLLMPSLSLSYSGITEAWL